MPPPYPNHCHPAGLSGLTRLRLARRPFLTDAQLAPLLAANRSSLQRLELAGCASLTDAALLHLLPPPAGHSGGGGEAGAGASQQAEGQGQAQAGELISSNGRRKQPADEPEKPASAAPPAPPPAQRQAPPPLERLQLVCCDRITGSSLRHLARLRSLHLSGCPAISGAALQVRRRVQAVGAACIS